MTLMSVGDLAKVFTMRRHSTELKQALERFSTESTTGQTADLSRTVRGDYAPIAGLHHALTALDAYKVSTDEASAFAAMLQQALEAVGTLASGGAAGLVQSSMSTNPTQMLTAGLDVKQRFFSAVSALNTRVADRTLLAGVRTDGPALAPAEDILAALRLTTATETTAVGFAAAVTAWFDDPAGYGTVAYLGASTPLAPFQIGEGEAVQLTTTANDANLRNTLKGMALGALVGEGALQGNRVEQRELARLAGETMLINDSALTYTRAEIGSAEARIGESATRNSAESASLQLAVLAITSVDPYQAASALQETQTQLETLYTITGRLANLHLTDFLR